MRWSLNIVEAKCICMVDIDIELFVALRALGKEPTLNLCLSMPQPECTARGSTSQ